MANEFPEATARWSKEWPNINGGIYWRRYSGSYSGEPEICVLNNGYLDSFSGKSTMSIPSEGTAGTWEFFGPITPEQVNSYDALRTENEALRKDLKYRHDALEELRRCRDRWLTALNPATGYETIDEAISALQAELKGLREAVESVCARHTESAKVSGFAKCACLDCTGLRAAVLHPQPEGTK